MDTIAPRVDPAVARKRNPLKVVLVIALVIIVATAIGGGVSVARYSPLEEGSSGGTPNMTIPYTDKDEPSFGTSTRVIEYVHKAQVEIAFSIRNGGRWAVDILAIPSGDVGLFAVKEVRRGVLNRCCVETERFAPFTLASGEERDIRFVGVLQGCRDWAPGSSTSWHTYDVKYRFLGLTRVQRLEMTHAFEIHVPDQYVCPEGTRRP